MKLETSQSLWTQSPGDKCQGTNLDLSNEISEDLWTGLVKIAMLLDVDQLASTQAVWVGGTNAGHKKCLSVSDHNTINDWCTTANYYCVQPSKQSF